MTVRCTMCNRVNSFRNYSGNKLSNQRCCCGGELQMVGGNYYISGRNLFEPEKTYTSKYREGEFFYAEANKKGEIFYCYDGYYHQIHHPVFAPVKQLTQ